MTPTEYTALLDQMGKRQRSAAARDLGVDRMTLWRRERGDIPITEEAARALRCLVTHQKRQKAG